MQRVRGVDADRCLVVPVDVGNSMAMSLVADEPCGRVDDFLWL